MKDLIEIRWHGRGGQGAKTAALLLGDAALASGKYIQAFPEYGPERMGAPIRAFTRISNDPIRIHSQVYEPDIVVVLDGTLVGKVDITGGLKKGGIVLVNTHGSPEEIKSALKTEEKCYTIDATKISIEELGRPMANTAILGALVKVAPIVAYSKLEDAVTAKFTGKLSEKLIVKNLTAMKRAYEEVR